MTNMLAAEWMKLRTRWLLYVLLFFLIVGATIQIMLFGFVAYLDERGDPEFGRIPPGFHTFAFPWSLNALLDSGQYWGGVFIAFLVASSVATEYGWGTVRAALSRGQARSDYLAAKLVGTALAAAGILLVALAIGVAISLLVTQLHGDPITFDVRDAPPAAEIPVMVLRAGLGILPYGMLAFTLTVLTRSTAVGATGTLIYKMGESIVVALFGEFGGIWEDLRVLFVGYHAESLIAANRFGDTQYNSIAFRALPEAADLPDPWVATFVLLATSAALAALAFAVFQRRDLNARTE